MLVFANLSRDTFAPRPIRVACVVLGLGISLAIQAADQSIQNAIGAATRDQTHWVRFPPLRTEPLPEQPTPTPATPQEAWIRFPVSKHVEPPPLAVPESTPVAVSIRAFNIQGNTRMDDQHLMQVLQPWVGKAVTLDHLQAASQAVRAAYQDHGWLVRVDMPEQDLTSGTVLIEVTEAKHSVTSVQAAQVPATVTEWMRALVDRRNPPGEPLNLRQLEQAHLILQEVPGVDASISLTSGQRNGETALEIQAKPGTPSSSYLSLDNAGARATGALRAAYNATFNGLMARGDQTILSISKSQGMSSFRGSYSEPFGFDGMRWGVYATSARYALIVPDLSAFNIRGPSDSVGVELNAPWIRRTAETWTAQLQLEQRHFRNDIAGDVHSNYQTRLLNASLLGRWSHNTSLGPSVSSLTLTGTSGNVDLSNSPNQLGDALTTQTAGAYQKLRFNYNRLQRINARQDLQMSLTSQFASKNLDSSEKLVLGGIQGVRAYPMNEAAGSEGLIGSLEWQHHKTLYDTPVTWAGFWDMGVIRASKFPNYVDAPAPNQYRLSGLGLWAGTTIPWQLGRTELRVIWSRRVGTHPASTATGLDQDGSGMRDRIWLSAVHPF